MKKYLYILRINISCYNLSAHGTIGSGGEVMVQDNYEALGALVEKARERKQLSRESLAEQLGITDRHLFSIERENKTPSYRILKKLIYTLEIPPEEIFYPDRMPMVTSSLPMGTSPFSSGITGSAAREVADIAVSMTRARTRGSSFFSFIRLVLLLIFYLPTLRVIAAATSPI